MHPFEDAEGIVRSLNRARVGTLPGDLATSDVIGRTGLELVSGIALGREITRRAGELGLDPSGGDPIRDFDGCLACGRGGAAQAVATDMAREFGRRLGCLLLALVRGDPETRATRPEWAEPQWAFWAGVRRVVLGGGLLSGRLGDLALPVARGVLAEHGADGVTIDRSPYGPDIALVGLARGAWPATPAPERLVLDFGQTSVKRGVASYADGALAGLRVLRPAPTVCPAVFGLSTDPEDVERQWQAMADLVAATVEEAAASRRADPTPDGPPGVDSPDAEVSIALACYMRRGHPEPGEIHSCYGRLQVLAPDLAEFARRELAARLDRAVRVDLLPDGTAAGLAVEGDADGGETTVVVTIGTAIGTGFPPPPDRQLRLAEGFAIERRGG